MNYALHLLPMKFSTYLFSSHLIQLLVELVESIEPWPGGLAGFNLQFDSYNIDANQPNLKSSPFFSSLFPNP